VEAEVVRYAERYLELQSILDATSQAAEMRQVKIQRPEEAERVSWELRERWCLGADPILSVTELLEDREQIVLVSSLPDSVSGLTCEVHRDGQASIPVLVANRDHSLERRRLTLIHELAHRLLIVPGDEKATEKAANRFAGAFLMPEPHLKHTLRLPRHNFQAPEILDLKRVYGVSAAAMWYRIHQLGYTTVSQYEYGCRTFAKTWRGKIEPRELEPAEKRGNLEIPKVFARRCFQALAEGLISVVKAAELLEWPIAKVEQELRGQA
jgi:Zn-dependent peptidase ImmA (M78 family)